MADIIWDILTIAVVIFILYRIENAIFKVSERVKKLENKED